MLTIFVYDDNVGELLATSRMIARTCPDADIHSFHHSGEALAYLRANAAPHIAVLGIQAPDAIGLGLASRMRETDWDGQIIFLSGSDAYAFESYRLRAVDYLLKPCTQTELGLALSRAADALEKADDRCWLIQMKHASRRIAHRDILFVEADKHRVNIGLTDGSLLSPQLTLKQCTEHLLKDRRFAHCHSSILVNMDHVVTLERNEAILHSGHRLPISRRYLNFKKQYLSYITRRQGHGSYAD